MNSRTRGQAIWRSKWLWALLAVSVVASNLAFRFYSEVDVKKPEGLSDPVAFINLRPLPKGWIVEWSQDPKAPQRVRITSPARDAALFVFAFRGNLDRSKFDKVEQLLYEAWPSPLAVVSAQGYGGRAIRRSFYVRQRPGKPRMYTAIDVIWHEAKEEHAYAVVATAVEPDSASVAEARSHLEFFPPRATAFGKTGRVLDKFFGRTELVFTSIMWLLAVCLGLAYTWEKLDRLWKPGKWLLLLCVVASGLVPRLFFDIHWVIALAIPLALLALLGIVAAFASKQVTLDVD